MKLDSDLSRFTFHASFLIERTPARSFTGDCEGGGEMSFELGDVEAGVYSIWIGDEEVGKLHIPSPRARNPSPICFGED